MMAWGRGMWVRVLAASAFVGSLVVFVGSPALTPLCVPLVDAAAAAQLQAKEGFPKLVPGWEAQLSGSEEFKAGLSEGPAAAGTAASRAEGDDDLELSRHDSFGYILEPNAHWLRRKGVHIRQMRDEAALQMKLRADGRRWEAGREFFQTHYEPSMHCDLLERVGLMGDGGKWICNPSRITEQVSQGKACLVYSFGSNGQFDFEEAVLRRISQKCEIHTFDPAPMSEWGDATLERYKDVIAHIKYHSLCLGPPGSIVQGIQCKPLSQIVKELGHEGRDVDIFKIDCEGCEWGSFKDWTAAPVNIRQINIELHLPEKERSRWLIEKLVISVRVFLQTTFGPKKSPPENPFDIAHAFFRSMFDSGYVVHAKEPNTIGCAGNCIEYGLIKMAPSFGVA